MKFLFAFLVGLGILISSLAHAHDAAAWIMQDSHTTWCCGPKDCLELPDHAVTHLLDGGYELNGEPFP